MQKIIIHNRSALDDEAALQAVLSVIRMGRISNNNKQYCYATTFAKVTVWTKLNKHSDVFYVEDKK